MKNGPSVLAEAEVLINGPRRDPIPTLLGSRAYIPFTHQHGISAKFYDRETGPDQKDRRDAYRHKHGEREPSSVEPNGSAAGAVPPVSAPSLSPSVFQGVGMFTTNDAGTASNHPCDWVAIQMDPEGDQGVIQNNPAQLCYWQARPTHYVVQLANDRGIPYIAQAENPVEMQVALELGPTIHVPKALVGKPDGWTREQYGQAIDQGWRLIAEWYLNAQPSMTAPDAGGYPYFDNVCFGIYSEGVPGGEGYVEQLPLSAYLRVWGGSYSVWKAEAMTMDDWAAFG